VQATIPQSFRKELGLRRGDRVVFSRNPQGDIVIRKLESVDQDWHRFVAKGLGEWSSSSDDKAFNDL
jgi:bifunctional DNA-binding transcriptional regulator/antitoxin component of YhaV-PrlF toxin-antitoxin module